MTEPPFTLALTALFALGFRHGFDADHLAAVSSLISKRRQHIFDAVGIGAAFALGHSLSAILFGLIGAVFGLSTEALIPELLDWSAGVLAAFLIIILGIWLVKGCVTGRCYERRTGYKIITLDLPRVEIPSHKIFKVPIIGQIASIFYRILHKVLYACSICLSNWVGFLFSISPPIPAALTFLVSLSAGNVLYGLVSVLVYAIGIMLAMVLVGASEGTIFEIAFKRNIKAHNQMIAILGAIVTLFGAWFLIAQVLPWVPAPWEHY